MTTVPGKQTRPLVVVTRPVEDSTEVTQALGRLGFLTLSLPLIAICTLSAEERGEVSYPWDKVDWLVLTSRNGVRVWAELGVAAAIAPPVATIGDRTAELFAATCGYTPQFVGSGENSEHFATEFCPEVAVGERIVVAGARERRGIIESALELHGAKVQRWNLYETTAVVPELSDAEIGGAAPVIWSFFSPSAVTAYVAWRAAQDRPQTTVGWRFVAFGATTGEALVANDLPVDVLHTGGSYRAFCEILAARYL